MVVPRELSEFFARHANLFWDGAFEELAESHYRHPHAVYYEEKLVVRQSVKDTAEALRLQRDRFLRLGATEVAILGLDSSKDTSIRAVVTLDWNYRAPSKDMKNFRTIRYFMGVSPNQTRRIEMVEAVDPKA